MRIVVRQISGLGNQLFQYAAGRYYAKRHGARMEVAIDPHLKAVSHGYPRPFLLSNFSISSRCRELDSYDRLLLSQKACLGPVQKLLRRTSGTQVITEAVTDRYEFRQDLPLKSNVDTVYLVGFWQAYRYPGEIENELRTEFRFREPPRSRNLETMEQIKQSEISVSLHIRRGDYTLQSEGNRALPIQYYYQAIRYFKDRFNRPKFFVFSDEIEYARQNLPQETHFVFVGHNNAYTAHEDLRLMSACQNHIIANSTLSWWAAWLNPNPQKIVFSPKYWLLKSCSYFPGLLPPNWVLAGDLLGISSQSLG